MKDLKSDEPVELIDMQVPIGTNSQYLSWREESPDESVPGVEEEAAPPGAFEYYNWDE